LSSGWSQAELAGALLGSGLLLLFDLALSVALAANASLSRVALRRVGADSQAQLGFLERMQQLTSPHRVAAALMRRLSLLGAILLLVLAWRGAEVALPVIGGMTLGVLLGVLGVEVIVAPALALWNPRRALRATAWAVRLTHVALLPVVRPLHAFLAWVERNQHLTDEEREEEQEDDVEAFIEVGEAEGLLEGREGRMMRGIVDLDETFVREIMTPRTDIVAVDVETSVAAARRKLLEAGHSRLPVYRESIDHVVGVLHARDLFRAWEEKKEDELISPYLRPAVFVPETLPAAELLAEMRQRMHLALVVDEYGGTAGLVTLEDLLEEIVGDIRDEHEGDEQLIQREANGSWLISAVVHVKELEELFDVEFEEREFDTVGGLVVFGFGRVPSPGERKQILGLEVEVLQADRRRVFKVRVREPGDQGEAQAGP
jgi:CBS domain containing-hemolysin-like protein